MAEIDLIGDDAGKMRIDTVEGQAAAALVLLSEGCLPIEVAAALDMPQAQYDAWLNPEHDDYQPVFANAIDVGIVKCQAWWIRQGRLGMTGKQFNHSAWAAVMKQAFAWQDKTVVETKDDSQQSMDAMLSWFRGMSADERAAIVQMRRDMTDDRHAQH